jgi:hypothetical protein
MSSPLDILEKIIIEAASSYIVVSEFEEIEGEDNAKALSALENERDVMLLSLLNYAHEFGPYLEAMIRKVRIDRYAKSDEVKDHDMMKALRGE